ncbi:MAG: SAM-dependent methyltransferase, partial [Proteobacteria bacterium]|nr:SAM-dependent methyltransferase [Pseudomonadota bacterium]
MRPLFLATSLISAAAIAYEILLMRMLSIVQWNHFAYMIISLALLGYGASGTFIALFKRFLQPRFELVFSLSGLLFSITMVACFVLGQRVPFNALELVWNPRQFFYLGVTYLVFFVPFFFAACCIGLAFTCRRSYISRIYFFDLLGAGLGAMMIVGALFLFSPQDTLILLAVIALLASATMGLMSAARKPLLATQLACLVALVFGLSQDWLEMRMSEYKGLSQAMQVVDSRVLSQSSSPLGLLTVVESPRIPFRYAPGLSINTSFEPPEQLAVFTDGDAMSVITRFDGDLERLAYLDYMTAALPYHLLDRPAVLILDAGGGAEVLRALYLEAGRIEAAESDPAVIRLLRGRFADFAGHIYDPDRTRVFAADARGAMAQAGSGYDLIQVPILGGAGGGLGGLRETYA